MELDGLERAEARQWLDSARVTQLVNRYFRNLDEKLFDPSRFWRIFAPDAELIRPNGAVVTGPEKIADSHARSFSRFESTQHLLSGHDVDFEGDKANLRANLIAIHIWKDRPVEASLFDRSFIAGGVVTAVLTRTGDGWRIRRIENRVIWRTGHLGDMLQFAYNPSGSG